MSSCAWRWCSSGCAPPARTRRRACLTYATAIIIAQLGWSVLIFFDYSLLVTLMLIVVLMAIEMSGPYIAERRAGGTPWHAHHIAERYGLLAIIALGEGVVGTVASVSAVVEAQGWSMDAALVCVAGMGLTFGMWWVYYIVPAAEVLHVHRKRSFVWGYGHMVIFAAIVATGAGLHVAAYFIEHKAHIGAVATLLTVAVPVSVYLLSIIALYTYLARHGDPLHLWLLAGTALVVVASVLAAAAGIPMTVCLIILMLAPVVTVVGYEMLGHRHSADVIAENVEEDTATTGGAGL